MEAVGARLGRSSSRYGSVTNTATVFSGPVRKWKKDWVPIPLTPSSNNSNHHHHSSSSSSSSALANGGSAINGGTNGGFSHLRLFKWTPVSHTTINKENSNVEDDSAADNDNNSLTKDASMGDSLSEQPPRRKFKYIPIVTLGEQKKEAEENIDDEVKPGDADEDLTIEASKGDNHGEKPDINDLPMEDNQATEEEEKQTAPGRQDLNKSLDLSLG